MTPCSFLYKDVYGIILRVNTSGEEDEVGKYLAVVKGYEFVCRQ
jgi:hypothetical protein